jgi:hypothetical protein
MIASFQLPLLSSTAQLSTAGAADFRDTLRRAAFSFHITLGRWLAIIFDSCLLRIFFRFD